MQGAYFHGRTRDDNRLEVGSEYYYVRRRMRFAGGDFDAHLEWSPLPSFVLSGGSNLIVDRERLPARIAVAKRSLEGARPGEVIPRASIYQGRKIFFNAAAYLQATYQTFDGRLGLTAGLRYDRHNVYGGQLSRRIGLVGQPFEKLHAKLLHGTAFQAPSPFLLYAVPASAGDVLGNRSLRPQFVNTFELQLEWEGWAPLTLSTDVAYSLIDDRTEFIQQGINKVARNVIETGTLSWENKAELQVQGWLNAYASFELQRTVLRTGQEGYAGQLIGSQGNIYPRAMVHAGLAAMPEGWPLRAAVLASYIGERRSSGNNTIRHGGTYSLEPYLLLEANLATRGFRILRHPEQELWFSFSAKNLLGATGPSPGFAGVDYPLSPRAFYLQANFRL